MTAIAIAACGFLAAGQGEQFEEFNEVLFDNGPFVTHKDGGPNNAARSEVDNRPPFQFLRLGMGSSAFDNVRLADDFTVPSSTRFEVSSFRFQIYRVGVTPPDVEWIQLRIWTKPPDQPSKAVFDKRITGPSIRLKSINTFRHYRDANGVRSPYNVSSPKESNVEKVIAPLQTTVAEMRQREIFTLEVKLVCPLMLKSGNYWLDWTIYSKALERNKESGVGPRTYSVMVTWPNLPSKIGANGIQYDRVWKTEPSLRPRLAQDYCFQVVGRKF